jgi:CRP-like cAMP-binding protein
MRTEVANALFESVLKHVKLFEMDDKTFLRQIASKVSHTVYLPGVCIVKEGDPGDTLYIVYKGRVSGVVDTDFSQDLKSVYLVGEVFGKLPAFFHDAWYKKSYRAEEYTEVLALSQTDILHLASVYSNFYKTLTAYIEVNYDPNGSFDCIFSEKSGKAKNIYDLGEEFLSSLQKRQTSSARAYKGDDKKEKEKRLFKKYKDMATHTKKLVEESKERSRLLSQSSLGATQNTKTKKKKKRSRHTNSKSQKSLKSVRSITSQKDVYSRKTAEKIKTEDLLKSAPSRDHVGRPLRKKSALPLGRGDSGGRSVSATGLGDSRRRQRRRKKTGRLEDENILNPIHELYDRRFEQAEKDGVSKPKALRKIKKIKKKHHHRRRKQSPHTPAPPDRPRKVQPREEFSHPEAGPSPKIKPKRKRPLKLSERPPWHY